MREFLQAKEARKAAASSTLSVSAVEFVPIRAGGGRREPPPVTQPSPNMAATSYANVLRGDSTTTDGVLRHGGAVTKDRRLAVPAV